MSIDRHIDSAISHLFEAEEFAKLCQLEDDAVRLRAIRRFAAKYKYERDRAKSAKSSRVVKGVEATK
jgi:hypothetical protein